MHILIAPGSYKGTLKSIEAAEIIAAALDKVVPNASVEQLVLADGGEGTLEAFSANFGCLIETHPVRNPIGTVVLANVGWLKENTAVIETSQAIGLSLLEPRDRNPFATSSYGVGELINHVVQRGAQRVLVTMGDSSTMDMGIGMLHALGVKFFSSLGQIRIPSLVSLDQIVDFDDESLRPLRESVTFVGLADTDDYLCGDIGQVRLFGRQKGLPEAHVASVESAYAKFARVIQRRLGIDVLQVIRSSGSGGLGAALNAFLNADLISSLEYISCHKPLDHVIASADVVITGEGCLDNQTRLGKVPHFVASRTTKQCVAIVGSYTTEGVNDLRKVCRGVTMFCMNPEIAMANPRRALREAVSSLFSPLKV